MRKRVDRRAWYLGLGVFVMIFAFTFLLQKYSEDEAGAANLAGFDAGYIISDFQMSNYNSMSEAQIQSFLKSKNSCDDTQTWRTGNNIDRLSETTPYSWHVSNGHYVCMADESFGGESAAHIIWQAAQDYRINPQVLIVLLQKEQGLVTDTLPNSVQYRSATGYGCPDTAACSSKYYGFKNQIRNAAALFRDVLDGGYTNYPLGNNYIKYNPNAACGGSIVNIKNLATSSLYRYTPYQPNAAVLSGGSDACSAYGNRNFYSYFEDWFGGIKQTQSSTKIAEGEYYIQVASNNSMVLDVDGGSSENGANIQLYTLNNSAAQKWEITYNSDTDDYNIINTTSRKALDVEGASMEAGANIQLWKANRSCAQRWKIISTKDDSVKLLSACSFKAIDVLNGQLTNKSNLQIWFDNGTKAQAWKLVPVESLGKEGMYTIRSRVDRSKVLDVAGGVKNATSGTNIQLWVNNNTGAQRWKIKEISNGYYSIINAQSKKVLDVYAGLSENGTNVQLWNSNKSCAQKWRIMKNKDDTFTFISACSNKVIDLAGANTNSGSNIQLYSANNSNAQRWTLDEIEIVNDGKYNIVSSLSENKVIDIASNSNENGTNIQLYKTNNTSAQEWEIKYNNDADYYSIINPATGKSLDAAAAGITNGTNVQLWGANGTCAQKWTIYKSEDGYIIMSGCSNLVVDVKDGAISDKTNIQLFMLNNTKAQKWFLK